MRNKIILVLSPVLLLLLFTRQIFAQNFRVYKSWNFESEDLGQYTDAEIKEDFKYTSLYSHNAADIVSDEINRQNTKVMRITHEPNKLGVGFEMNVDLEADYDELYLSFNWKFSPEFNSNNGGKMPGLGGLPEFGTDIPTSGEGFRAHNLFKYSGMLASYHYDRTKSVVPWGTDEDSVYMVNGTWYNITQRLVMNTFTNGVANSDGIKEVWINGRLVLRETNLKLMQDQSSTMKIDAFRLTNFYGGSGYDFMPQTECYGYIDNIKVYIPLDDPVRGRQLHNAAVKLTTPDEISDKRFYYDRLISSPGKLSNSQYGSNYSSCIDETYLIDSGEGNYVVFTLNKFSLSSDDALFFYDGNTADAKLIARYQASSGSSKVIRSKGRYLFVRFSTNTSGESSGWTGSFVFSSGGTEDQVTSAPDAPSMLTIEDFGTQSISVSWMDNSTNEESFVISRYEASDPEDVTNLLVDANDTIYTDNGLTQGKTYVYSVKAINDAGISDNSNEKIATTLSSAENKRVWSGIIAYYNFTYNPDMIVYDVSGYGEPLNLKIQKSTSVTWQNNDIRLDQNTMIVSTVPAKKIMNEIKLTNEITIECWIRPDEPDISTTGRILSLGNNNSDMAFAIDQKYVSSIGDMKSIGYVTRISTNSTSASGLPETEQEDMTSSYINLHHVVYVKDKNGNEKVYIDGVLSGSGFRPGTFENWKDNYYLKFGNESDMSLPWKGTYYMVALYKNALSKDQIMNNFNAGPKDNVFNKGMKFDVTLYPNPVNDLFTTNISPIGDTDKPSAPSSIRIIDSNGKVLYNEYIFNQTVSFKKSFDMLNALPGIYFFQIISGNEKQSLKIIKK